MSIGVNINWAIRYLFLLLLISPFAYGQTKLSFINKSWTDPELNTPGKGAEFWNGVQWDNIGAPQVPNGAPFGFQGYSRYNWFELEGDVMGSYKFSGPNPSFEFMLRKMIDWGLTYSFGIMTVCEGCDRAWDNGQRAAYPYYLHALMQSEPSNSRDWYSAYGYWVPNWNSNNYLQRFEALLDTLSRFIAKGSYIPSTGPHAGKRIFYKDVVNYIDIRGYGNFGEWHNHPYRNDFPAGRAATASTLIRIIDAHKKAFPDYPLIALSGSFDGGDASYIPPEVTNYMLATSNNYGKIGWRRDNWGGPEEDNRLAKNPGTYAEMRFDTAIVNRYKYAMVTGEPIKGGSQYAPKNKPYADLRREINVYHPYGFGNGNYPASDISKPAVRDTLNEAFKLTGYRFNLNGGSISSNLYTNTPFNITLRWRNVGAAPLYQKKWKVKYQLRNEADQVLQEWDSYFNPYLYLPAGKDSVVSQNFMIGNVPAGTNYKLTIRIIDTSGYHPPLFMALKTPARNADGSYTLRSKLTVAAGSTASPNLDYWLQQKEKNKTPGNKSTAKTKDDFWDFQWLSRFLE